MVRSSSLITHFARFISRLRKGHSAKNAKNTRFTKSLNIKKERKTNSIKVIFDPFLINVTSGKRRYDKK